MSDRTLFTKVLERIDLHLLRHSVLPFSGKLRIALLRAGGARVASNVTIGPGVRFLGIENLEIRSGASIARDCTLDARGGLTLGEGCLIGFESILLTCTHRSEDASAPIQEQGMFTASVYIGGHSWLGTRSIVLPGCDVGEGTIVGAASVVTRSLPSRVTAAGVPARKIKERQ